jgi:hypothetical protein
MTRTRLSRLTISVRRPDFTETGHFRLAGRRFLLRLLICHCRVGAFAGFRFPFCGGFSGSSGKDLSVILPPA